MMTILKEIREVADTLAERETATKHYEAMKKDHPDLATQVLDARHRWDKALNNNYAASHRLCQKYAYRMTPADAIALVELRAFFSHHPSATKLKATIEAVFVYAAPGWTHHQTESFELHDALSSIALTINMGNLIVSYRTGPPMIRHTIVPATEQTIKSFVDPYGRTGYVSCWLPLQRLASCKDANLHAATRLAAHQIPIKTDEEYDEALALVVAACPNLIQLTLTFALPQ